MNTHVIPTKIQARVKVFVPGFEGVRSPYPTVDIDTVQTERPRLSSGVSHRRRRRDTRSVCIPTFDAAIKALQLRREEQN